MYGSVRERHKLCSQAVIVIVLHISVLVCSLTYLLFHQEAPSRTLSVCREAQQINLKHESFYTLVLITTTLLVFALWAFKWHQSFKKCCQKWKQCDKTQQNHRHEQTISHKGYHKLMNSVGLTAADTREHDNVVIAGMLVC